MSKLLSFYDTDNGESSDQKRFFLNMANVVEVQWNEPDDENTPDKVTILYANGGERIFEGETAHAIGNFLAKDTESVTI
jgi:hypothetical protein